MIDPEAVASNAEVIRQRIAEVGADPDAIELIAVTKGFGAEAIIAARQAGFEVVGESYAQELIQKWPAVVAELGSDTPTVHFIGGLQKNKIRKLADIVGVWQSVDRSSVAAELAKRQPGATVFVQINVSGSAAQGGCPIQKGATFVEECRVLGLDVAGCMAIGPQGDDQTVRDGFDLAARFADEHALAIRSFGMTGDLEHAVTAGSTMVRIGTALFGARPSRAG